MFPPTTLPRGGFGWRFRRPSEYPTSNNEIVIQRAIKLPRVRDAVIYRIWTRQTTAPYPVQRPQQRSKATEIREHRSMDMLMGSCWSAEAREKKRNRPGNLGLFHSSFDFLAALFTRLVDVSLLRLLRRCRRLPRRLAARPSSGRVVHGVALCAELFVERRNDLEQGLVLLQSERDTLRRRSARMQGPRQNDGWPFYFFFIFFGSLPSFPVSARHRARCSIRGCSPAWRPCTGTN